MSSSRSWFLFVSCLGILLEDARAYDVWISTTKVPRTVITKPMVSENTRRLIDGFNLNFAELKPTDGAFAVGEEPMRTVDWQTFFATLRPAARRGMVPIPRTVVFHPDLPMDRPEIEAKLESIFSPDKIGYRIDMVMPYDNAIGSDASNDRYSWTLPEMDRVRDWLDTSDGGSTAAVHVARNVRNFALQRQVIAEEIVDGAVDTYLFEANPTSFYSDQGRRQLMLDYFFESKDPKVLGTKLYFQIPLDNWQWPDEPGATPYQMVRNFVVWLGDRYGPEVLRGDRVTFLITTYHAGVRYYPELKDGTVDRYEHSLLGTALSLIEQEPLFTGLETNPDGSRLRPTKAHAYSDLREVPVSVRHSPKALRPSRTLVSNAANGGIVYLPGVSSWSVLDLHGGRLRSGSGSVAMLGDLPRGLYLMETDRGEGK